MKFNVKLIQQGDTLTSVRTQYGRDEIIETVAQLRQGGGAPDRPGFGRFALVIPQLDWLALREKYPELASSDIKIKSRAYHLFMRSDESKPYRLREKI
jgi:hypothetical protein